MKELLQFVLLIYMEKIELLAVFALSRNSLEWFSSLEGEFNIWYT